MRSKLNQHYVKSESALPLLLVVFGFRSDHPAVRNGQPASQFLTLVYEFKDGKSRKPYVPRTEF
jgi:hypothetical protein